MSYIGVKVATVLCALYPVSHTAGLGTVPKPKDDIEWKLFFGILFEALNRLRIIHRSSKGKFLLLPEPIVPLSVYSALEGMGFEIIKKEEPKVESSYEGKQTEIKDLPLPLIESWLYQFADSGNEQTVEVITPEFTCICPKTGLPDFATLTVKYQPADRCLELKSFKEYLHAYREVGIFHEHMVQKVLADCVKAVGPVWMEVTGKYLPRGGVYTNATATYSRPSA